MFTDNNELLLQRLFPTSAPTIRSPQFTSPYLMPSTPIADFQNPLMMLQSNLQQQLLLNILAPSSPLNSQQQILNQIQLQLLCQHPDSIRIFSQITGSKLVGTKEVPDERLQDTFHEKISPIPQQIQLVAPTKPISRKRASSSVSPTNPPKKHKNLRKLHNVDVETNSPVSGMWIKEASEISADDMSRACELDDSAPFVNINEESKRRVAEIPNIIGGSKCFLCKRDFLDVFRLAMHRCPRIGHQEYKCPECGKIFSCPANLASHRRWHLPRGAHASICTHCSLPFETKKALREHKCPQKTTLSPPSSISSTTMSETETMSSSTVSPDFIRGLSVEMPPTPSSSTCTIDIQEPQPPIICLGLNSGSLQLGGFKKELEE